MKEIEQYFKIYFDEGGNDNMKYFIEEQNINSELDFIPLLTQGYVRCLNNLKTTFGHDKKSSEFFNGILKRILLLSYENIDLIDNNFENISNFNILNFLIEKDTETRNEASFLNKIFNSFLETKTKTEITSNVNVKYEIKISTQGSMIMYNVSLRMDSFIQIQAYIIMLVHFLPRFNNFKAFLFFVNYMIEIDKEINKNDYSTISGMKNIIINASNNFRKIAIEWLEIDNNDYFNKLILCLPKTY